MYHIFYADCFKTRKKGVKAESIHWVKASFILVFVQLFILPVRGKGLPFFVKFMRYEQQQIEEVRYQDLA